MIGVPALQAVGKRYILYEQIGEGGMGVVYRALDRLTGKRRAQTGHRSGCAVNR